MVLDTSLSKLTRNAYTILTGAYAKLPTIAIQAIDAQNSPKQPTLYNQLIQVSALFEQINSHIVYNAQNTAIIGIQGEDVAVINDLILCLRDVAELTTSAQFPTPFTNFNVCDINYVPMPVEPLGTLIVSNGTAWTALPMGAPGTVLTASPTGLVYSSAVGNGLPPGGLQGQFLIKNSNTSYDVIWDTLTLSQVTDVTASPAEVNILDGVDTVNIGPTQINTLNGINTGTTIQVQINGKLSSTLPNGQFWVGNASNIATPVAPTGDVVFNNVGVFAIQPNVIVDADVSTTAAIARTKLASGNSNRIVINNASGVMTEAAAIFPGRALVSDANGIPTHSDVTTTVLSYISTLTSNAQNQLNNKLTVNITSVAQGDTLYYNGSQWVNLPVGAAGEVLTSDGTTVNWGSATSNGLPVGGTTAQYLRKIDGTNYNAEWHTLILDDITDINATSTEVNLLSGLTVNATQLNYTSEVTSSIQDQLDTKLPISLAHHSIWVGGPSDTAVQTSAGVNGSVLTIVSGHPVWQTPPSPGTVSGVSSTDNAVVRWNGAGGVSIQDSGVIMDDSNNITGVASLSSGQISILNQAALRLYETGSTNYIAIRSSGTMASDYTITLPAAAPSANTALTYDGANYVWSAASGVTDFLSLTDVAASSYTGEALKLVRVNAGETGLEFVTPSGTGTVTSVSGTTNRITITGTATINPTVDIAATYVGQASITTLGTITTGVWNGTDVALGAGGTGATLSAPGVDSIFFYDFSALSSAFLTIGTGLSITGTVLSATGSFTTEDAQDAVGTILTDTATIDFTYNDGTPTISAIVVNNSIGNAQLRQGGALSVIGNATNATANVADISAGTDGHVLRRSGTTLGFGTIGISSITMNNNRMLGRYSPSPGAVEEIQIENGLTFTGGFLRWGGTMTQNTNFVGGGHNLTGSGFGSIQFSGTDAFLGTSGGSGISINNAAAQTLSLGASGGAVLNLGGDTSGDMYIRNSLGKFVRMPIGAVGQNLITSTSGIPSWSNIIVETISGTTHTLDNTENGKLLVFTHGSGCTVTVPDGTLMPQWQALCYRLGGTVSFTPASGSVDLEGVGTSMPVVETMASIVQRASNIFVLSGALTLIGSGTVTSVGLSSIPGFITVGSSPIVTSGTMSLSLDNQAANFGFFGPAVSGSAAPTFRAMVLKDLPNDTYSEIPGPTYTFLESDNKLIKYCTDPAGCTITIPSALLTNGWACTIYRLGGTVTFISDGTSTLEGAITTISVVETYGIVSHRGSDIFVVAGASAGGGGGASAFTDLTDTPSAYTGHGLKLVRVNTGETGLEFVTAVAGGTVTSVSGVSNRTTITGTPTVNPTVDIAATYVGQSSITTLGTIATGTWQGTSISTTYTDAKVASISGVTNRTTISGTLTVPVVDISATYVGQSSITTLGTIATGTWQGTSISTTYTDAKVASISGVTNRTTISGTLTVPVVDISATYVGQTSITTLGTVATGTWNATTIGVTKGGTGLTSIGTANQVLGVNSTATALEYKSITTGTTAVSNNVGITHVANSLIIQVPDASATVRGVVTTGTQSFAGAKTFTNNLLVGSTTNGAELSSSTGLLTLYSGGASASLGAGANHVWLTKTLQINTINITTSTSGLDTTCATISRSAAGSTEHNNRFTNSVAGTGFLFSTSVSSAYGAFAYNMVRINTSSGAAYSPSLGGGIFRSLLLDPTYNVSTGGTAMGIVYAPIETLMTNVTHYGLLVYTNSALSSFGAFSPTAKVHIGAGNTTVAPLKINSSAGSLLSTLTAGVQDGAIEYNGTHLYVVIGSTRYQLDQQSGTLSDGDKGDITVSSSGAVWTIDNDAVTYAKMQNVSATSRIMGRITASAGDMEEMTGTQATTLLDVFTTSLKGLVPAATGGSTTTQFLRKDGTWAVPAGGGGGITNGAANTEIPQSDGTNLIASGVFIPSHGNLNFGSDAGTSRYSQATGSGTNIDFRVIPKGSGNVILETTTGDVVIGGAGATGNRTVSTGSSSTNASLFIEPKGDGNIEFSTSATGNVYVGSTSLTGHRTLRVGSSSGTSDLTVLATGVLRLHGTTGLVFSPDNSANNYLQIQPSTGLGWISNTAGTHDVLSLLNTSNDTKFTIESTATTMSLTGGSDGSSTVRPFTIRGGQGTNGGDSLSVLGGLGGGNAGGNLILSAGTGAPNGYILMQNLPTSSAGLPSGAIWNNSNVLTIVP